MGTLDQLYGWLYTLTRTLVSLKCYYVVNLSFVPIKWIPVKSNYECFSNNAISESGLSQLYKGKSYIFLSQSQKNKNEKEILLTISYLF